MNTETILGSHVAESSANVVALVDLVGDRVLAQEDYCPRQFKIRAADEGGHRSSANILIERRYAWRGYQNASLPEAQSAHRMTFSAMEADVSIGTITIGLDGPEAVHAEEVFGAEVAALRQSGQKICEFTKLAMDPVSGSRRVLASLFHVAYLVAHRLRGYDMLILEVNPRHVAYYRRMLGCRVLGEERMNPRVNAPAVLLGLAFSHIRKQIEIYGGRTELAASERSLYPYAFSASEEAGIISRMQNSAASLVQTVH